MSGISVQGLAKRFGARTAVEGLTFDVRPGEVGVIAAKQRRGPTGTEWLANRLHHASLSSLG